MEPSLNYWGRVSSSCLSTGDIMELVVKVRDAHVFDDVLSDEEFQQIWELINIYPYERTDAILWQKAWSIADGAILRGPQWIARAPDWTLVPPERPSKDLRPFPADPPPLVRLLEKVREACTTNEGLPEISGAAISPFVWPPGTSLAWHADGMSLDNLNKVGAFTFYAHKTWNCEWGGELLIADIDSDAEGISSVPTFDNSALSERIMATGHGAWVAPKPNRLVINPNNILHKVNKSTLAAPPRLSIQAFMFEDK